MIMSNGGWMESAPLLMIMEARGDAGRARGACRRRYAASALRAAKLRTLTVALPESE